MIYCFITKKKDWIVSLRAYYYKGQLIKAVFDDEEHYCPFENIDEQILESSKNLYIPKKLNRNI